MKAILKGYIVALWVFTSKPSFSQETQTPSRSDYVLLSCHLIAPDNGQTLDVDLNVNFITRSVNGFVANITDQMIVFGDGGKPQNITQISRLTGNIQIISPFGVLFGGMCRKIDKPAF